MQWVGSRSASPLPPSLSDRERDVLLESILGAFDQTAYEWTSFAIPRRSPRDRHACFQRESLWRQLTWLGVPLGDPNHNTMYLGPDSLA